MAKGQVLAGVLLLLLVLLALPVQAAGSRQTSSLGDGVVKVLKGDEAERKGSLKVTRRYYTQLDSLAKKLYNALEEASLRKGFTFKFYARGTVPRYALDDNQLLFTTAFYKKVENSLIAAKYAYRLDRVDRCLPLDEFSLSNLRYKYRGEGNGKVTMVFYSVRVTPDKAYQGSHSDMGAVRNGIERLREYVLENRASSSRYDTLYTLARYMTGHFTHGDSQQAKSYTAASLLLDKFHHTGVCEAYAKLAFTVCRQLNIPVIYVESKTHAYNYVMMENGKWYGYDTDWIDNNDPANPYSMDMNWFLYGTREMEAHDSNNCHRTELLWGPTRLKAVSISDTSYPLKMAA